MGAATKGTTSTVQGLSQADVRVLGLGIIGTAAAGIIRYAVGTGTAGFIVAGVALALLASTVGRSVEGLGTRLGAGATGVVQSALGNLPELFVAIFALRKGLNTVVQATIVGSILSNVLLVLGLAFIAGGLKHGTQSFDPRTARSIMTLLLLAVSTLLVPTLAHSLHTPAAAHEGTLSTFCAVILLIVFVLSVPESIRRKSHEVGEPGEHESRWSLPMALGILAAAGVAAAFVSDWFVASLEPAIKTLGISQAFAGLVVVAIAGNAVENVVGIQLAYRGRPDYALPLVLYSPLQVALALAPVLVLLSHVIGAPHVLTLDLGPLLSAELVIAMIVTSVVVNDGESTWLEGATLVGLYAVLAAGFWWG
jgi:Ca2+:H+ antiporter